MGESSKIDEETVKLYVGGISTDWTNEKITEILSPHGKIVRVDVVKNFAFAFVNSQKTADNIIKEVSGKTFDGQRLVIQISKNKQNLLNCDANVCFECGQSGHWAKECAQRKKRESMNRRDGPPPHPPPRGRYGNVYDYPPPRERDPYARDHYARDPYDRSFYSRDPYGRDPYTVRDPYARDYGRDPYARNSYAYEYDRYRERSPTSYAAYRRPVSPSRSSYASVSDPYAAARERLAYGRAVDPYESTVRRPIDPYDTARRALDAVRRADAYAAAAAARSADPYERERYPEAAPYPPRP